jgi:tRNA threonylcarbamoyladenosine biosynthesis protein TsaE
LQLLIKTESDMLKLGKALASVLQSGDVVCLHGVLGAGKTTLVRGVARGKGYQQRVTSPTFNLMNIYQGRDTIYHFDFYRLGCGDLSDLGLEDYLEKDGLCLIEWPEVGQEYMPAEAMHIYIELVDEDYERERLVRVEALGQKYGERLKELEQIVDTGG